MASNVYIPSDGPNYRPGHGVVFSYLTLFLLGGSLFTHFMLIGENKKRQAGKRDDWVVGKSDSEIEMLGDKRPDFLYTT